MPGGAGDADAGELVGGEDLLDVALGDDVAHRGAPVTGHHHAARERRGDDRGAVRREVGRRCPRGSERRLGSRSGACVGEEVGERRGARRAGTAPEPSRESLNVLLAALLDERLHEVLGVGLEHVVDLVEDRVDVLVELLLALGDVALRCSLGLAPRSPRTCCGCFCSCAMQASLCELLTCRGSDPTESARANNASAVSQRSNSSPTCALAAAQRVDRRHPLQRLAARAGRRSPSPRRPRRSGRRTCSRQRPRK